MVSIGAIDILSAGQALNLRAQFGICETFAIYFDNCSPVVYLHEAPNKIAEALGYRI